MFTSSEIHSRVKSGYIERVNTRLRKMRKQLVDRDWSGLKQEAHHLAEGARNFGYPEIATEVEAALRILQSVPLSRTAINTEAKGAMERLFQRLDRFLVEEQGP
jgi:HPt (histidine-containing phosphotransfer) domain-containing protein